MSNRVVPARGMRDILPADKAKRDRVMSIIRSTYQSNGFAEIETPAVEPLTRLRSDQGGDNEKMLFEIMKRGLPADQPIQPGTATDLGLRYDLTVPLTRFYATNVNELPKVFRSLQTGPVWRSERPQKGRYRQFTQCDIDVLGDDSIIAEIDLLTSTLTAFEALGMSKEITLLVNDRRILSDLLTACGFDPILESQVLVVLDKFDKVGADGVRDELLSRQLGSTDSVETLLRVAADLRQQGNESLRTEKICVSDEVAIGMRDLPAIVLAVQQLVPWAKIRFDATMVRGMGYYSGPIFEIKHSEVGFSLAGGGRYDRVVGKWLGREVPACGFSIGFERIIDLAQLPAEQTERIALLYRPDADPVRLLKIRSALQSDGASVTLVIPPRRTVSAFFQALKDDGFTHCLDGTRDGATAADKQEL